MWNGPDNVVYKRYMSCRDRPQMNYYNLFLFVTVWILAINQVLTNQMMFNLLCTG